MKIKKLLQALVSPKAQRFQVALSFVISVLMLLPLGFQLKTEHSRAQFPQLDASGLKYCALENCVINELAGLEVVDVQIIEQKWATFVEVRFVNHGRLRGERELYLELLNDAAELSEAAKTRLILSSTGPLKATFSFQRTPELLQNGTLRLAF